MISYQKYTKNDIKLAQKIILEHELYNAPFSAGSAFWAFAASNTFSELIEEFIVAVNNEKPIGIAFRLRGYGMYGASVTCYVRREHRRKGIGSQMVKMFDTKEYNNREFPEGFPKCQQI